MYVPLLPILQYPKPDPEALNLIILNNVPKVVFLETSGGTIVGLSPNPVKHGRIWRRDAGVATRVWHTG